MNDPILYWNDVALAANRADFTREKPEQGGPTLSSRALAIVHLAMYDAYAGIINDPVNLPPYLSALPAPAAGASPDEAVAAAAHASLSALFPSQKMFFNTQYAGAGLMMTGPTSGHLFGLEVARRILEDRKDDPGAGDDGYAPMTGRGMHRADPDNPMQGYHAPFYGAWSKCFAVTARHGLNKPPALVDPDYLKALKEVRGKGIAPELMGTLPPGYSKRTVDETLIGIYWGYDGASDIGTPPRWYNQIVRAVAMKKGNSVADNARLFAFVNAAMADAGILAWDQKYEHNFWRPILGIREHDKSMGSTGMANNNIDNDCDTSWLPLGAPSTNSYDEKIKVGKKNFTPPFPAYPSGHATFGAAALQVTRLFYGVTTLGPDSLAAGCDFVSDEFNGMNRDNKGTVRPRHVRSFSKGLWQMIEENGRSRVYLGVHWVFDAFAVKNNGEMDLSQDIGGVPLGLKIAQDIFTTGGGKAPKKSTVGPKI